MRSIRNAVVRAAVLGACARRHSGRHPPPAPVATRCTAENGSNQWLVELKGSAASFRGEAKKAGVKFNERFAFSELWNGVSIVADPAQVGTIESLPSVAAVYPNQTFSLPDYQPDLNFAGALTGADLVKSDLGFDGSGIRVAVMDTGIDYDHPDLGGCFGAGCRVTNGWDFVGDAYNASAAGPISPIPNPDPNPDDCNGHGSHVAGIVGANGRIDGVAPGVTFGAYRVFGCEGDTTVGRHDRRHGAGAQGQHGRPEHEHRRRQQQLAGHADRQGGDSAGRARRQGRRVDRQQRRQRSTPRAPPASARR